MPGIDLHTHSTASDGSLSPSELVAAAKEAGLQALALTDHDTTAGLDEAARAALELDLEFIRGCELSVKDGRDEMHILGLWLPERPAALLAAMDELNRHRADRNRIIADKLAAAGVDVSYQEVLDLAGEGSVGRPHFARLLMDKGCAKDVQHAFDRYLGPTGLAYEPKKILDPEAAIKLLAAEGATVVMAHPYALRLGRPQTENRIAECMAHGLSAIEAHYTEHSPAQTAYYLELARRFDLGVAGGSDFHGAVKPDIRLGVGRGSLHVPYACLEDLKRRRRQAGLPV